MIELFPGLRSLRAFDAAARHLSFTRAAEDLRVTPAAISHQIRELEDQIGAPLFARTSRSMRLTREGEILKAASAESLEILTRALQRIRKLKNQQQLKVSASPSVGAKWLVPRLERFMAAVPGAEVIRSEIPCSRAWLRYRFPGTQGKRWRDLSQTSHHR